MVRHGLLFIFLMACTSFHAMAINIDSLRIQRLLKLAESTPTGSLHTAMIYADSALRLAEEAGDEKLVADVLTSMGNIHRENSLNEKACEYYKDAIDENEDATWVAPTYLQAGIALLRRTMNDTAFVVLSRGLNLATKGEDKSVIAAIYNVMGNIRREQNQFEQALQYYISSVRLFEELNNLPGLAQALSNIGNIHNLLNQPDHALTYARESLEIARKAGIQSSVAYAHRLIGRIQRKKGNLADALASYKDALATFETLGSRREVGETHINIGNIYFDQQKFNDATSEYVSALKIVKAIPDTLLMAYAYSAIGQTMMVQDKNAGAGLYLDSSIVVARRKNLINLEMDAMQALSEMYEKAGNYRLSHDFYRRYIALRDTVTERQNRKAVLELEQRFQVEKKDNAIRLLDAENRLKSSQQIFLALLAVIAMLIAFVLFNRYNAKRKANEKLRELDNFKSRFFTNVSHEFRTPLTLILSPLDELVAEETDPRRREVYSLMQRNARQLQGLAEQVLDLSRIEAGKMTLELQEDDLAHFIRVIASPFQAIAERKGISFRLAIDSSLTKACFDHDKVSKIVNNLLSNAFKFTGEGGTIALSARADNDIVVIEVKDSGIGIPEDEQLRIFDRFYQVRDEVVRASIGSGIGLTLAKELTELHLGTIHVSSKSGIGSVFTVRFPYTLTAYKGLPIKKPAIDDATWSALFDHHVHSLHIPITESDDARPLIMVVEDHDDMAQYIGALLSREYRVEVCVNSSHAVERAVSLIPDLIVTDWMMPGMDGKVFAQYVRSSEATCHIPILMLTARADQPSRIEGLEAGIDDYLAKPFDNRELLVRIANLLQQRKMLREAFRQEVILRPGKTAIVSRDAEFLSRLHSLLEERHSDPELNLDDLADELAMSRMQLHRKVKALTGQSPGELLRSFRLERAKHLLSASGMQVSEVCYKVGFNNVSYFSKVFREQVGQTPTEFIAGS